MFPYNCLLLLANKFSTENVIISPSLFSINFSIPEVSETQNKSPYVFFSALWDKNFLIEKRDTTPPHIQKAFRQQIFPETPKGSSTNCFGTRRHKQLNVKLWYSPFLLSLNFFETRTILGHKKRPQRNASVVQNKNFLLLKRAIGSETENNYSNNKTKNFVVENPSVSSHQEIEKSSTA